MEPTVLNSAISTNYEVIVNSVYCGYRGNSDQTRAFGSEWLFGCPVLLHVLPAVRHPRVLHLPRFQILHLGLCQLQHSFAFLRYFDYPISLTTSTCNPHHSSGFQGPHIPSRPIRVVPCSASAPSTLTWTTIIGLISGPALTPSTCQPRQQFSPEVLVTDISAGAFGNGWTPHLLTSYTTRKLVQRRAGSAAPISPHNPANQRLVLSGTTLF